ncbi:MAG: hypothetical protein ACTSUE_13870 [Promethearchaeota archaeon]
MVELTKEQEREQQTKLMIVMFITIVASILALAAIILFFFIAPRTRLQIGILDPRGPIFGSVQNDMFIIGTVAESIFLIWVGFNAATLFGLAISGNWWGDVIIAVIMVGLALGNFTFWIINFFVNGLFDCNRPAAVDGSNRFNPCHDELWCCHPSVYTVIESGCPNYNVSCTVQPGEDITDGDDPLEWHWTFILRLVLLGVLGFIQIGLAITAVVAIAPPPSRWGAIAGELGLGLGTKIGSGAQTRTDKSGKKQVLRTQEYIPLAQDDYSDDDDDDDDDEDPNKMQ